MICKERRADTQPQVALTTLTTTGLFTAGSSVTGTIPPGLAGSTVNGLYAAQTLANSRTSANSRTQLLEDSLGRH